MKKIILFIICSLFLFLFFFSGCSAEPIGGRIIEEVTFTSEPSPTPSPVETAPPEPKETPEPEYPEDELTAKDGEYTVAWISDPQHYSKQFPEIYTCMTEFLSEQKDRLNLKYIVHTGDFIHNAEEQYQWENAVKAQSVIEDIPNGVLAGNHDVMHEAADYSLFTKYFGEDKYSDKPYYAESFQNNRGHVDLIDIGNTKYAFVYMGYVQTDKGIKWLNEMFEKYSDRTGILVLHDYIDNEGKYTEDGQKLFNKVVKKNANIKFVLCGHRYRLCNIDTELDDDGDGATDRTVHQILGNYQAAGDFGGSGFMRFFKINESEGKVYMYSYSPYLDEYVYYDEPERCAEKYATDPALETVVFDFAA